METECTYKIYNALAVHNLFGEKSLLVYQDLCNEQLEIVKIDQEPEFLQSLEEKGFEFTENFIPVDEKYLNHKWLGASSGEIWIYKITSETQIDCIADAVDEVSNNFGYQKQSDEFVLVKIIFD